MEPLGLNDATYLVSPYPTSGVPAPLLQVPPPAAQAPPGDPSIGETDGHPIPGAPRVPLCVIPAGDAAGPAIPCEAPGSSPADSEPYSCATADRGVPATSCVDVFSIPISSANPTVAR